MANANEALRMKNRLGSRILGTQAVEKITEARRTGTNRYGPRVMQPSEASTADSDANGYTSLDEVRTALKARPELLDRLIDAEDHAPRPRKGAFRLFLNAELASETPRDEVVAALQAKAE